MGHEVMVLAVAVGYEANYRCSAAAERKLAGKNMNELTDRARAFRAAIAGFIEDRREAKLKDKESNTAASRYDYATWLADAARRVGQIQAVTHVLKATHPDARGSNLHVIPSSLPQRAEIGSHLLLDEDYVADVVGNAAALDVFKLLKVEVDGKRLLDWMQAGDADLRAALSDNVEQAQDWVRDFASLVREDAQPASHTMAKQLYWLAGEDPRDDANYHLLQPMFASSLAHVMHADIEDARFGETSKRSRQARRDSKPGDAYRDYRGLVVRKLGGTKPQNISQLNSERRGMNYLLASLPPSTWKPKAGANLLKLDSVFDIGRGAFFVFGEVRELLRALADFLKTNPDQNKGTRDRIEASVQAISQELALFGTTVRSSYSAGWSRDTNCRLPLCEQLWLDPDRIELPLRDEPEHPRRREDELAFNQAYELGDWPDEVATRFGLWLNGQLRKRSEVLAALGEAEMRHFASNAILDVAWPIPLQRRAKTGAA